MENFKNRVKPLYGKKLEAEFYQALSTLVEASLDKIELNGNKEGLLNSVPIILSFIKRTPICWEYEVKREFVESLIEMAGKYDLEIASAAEEVLIELCFSLRTFSKKTRKEEHWFDFGQTTAVLDLLEEGGYREQEACRCLRN